MTNSVKDTHVNGQMSPLELSRELQATEDSVQSHLNHTNESGENQKKVGLHVTQPTHSVDVALGYEELVRARLIGFLRKFKEDFRATSVERGLYQHEKLLRVYTPMGHELKQYLGEHFPGGNDLRIVVHESEAATNGYKKFRPDTETEKCRDKFDL